MSKETLARSLQVAYPSAIFIAMLATWVSANQVGDPQADFLLPHPTGPGPNRTVVLADTRVCSRDLLRLFSERHSCPDESASEWKLAAGGNAEAQPESVSSTNSLLLLN